MTPSKVEASALASHFPSRPDIGIGWKGRNKEAKVRLTKVSVILLEKFTSSIPKGRLRQKLAESGRIMSIRLSRTMSSRSIREKIESAFSTKNFMVLECVGGGHQLVKAADQEINAEEVVSRRGSLYLCGLFPEVSLSTSWR